jgi:hypothetical protein
MGIFFRCLTPPGDQSPGYDTAPDQSGFEPV